VKLLFDENLAPRLVYALADLFPASEHVHSVGLAQATDEQVWRHARDHGFTIVSKDSDFHERSLLFGFPPKVVWIRRGNCSTDDIERLLRDSAFDIERLDSDPGAAFLIVR
jgi:predicted nuclease of predicted toxin-antitoxin system